MTEAMSYRSLAAQMRREARATNLPCVRNVKLAAAERWEVLAEELEHFGVRGTAHKDDRAAWIY